MKATAVAHSNLAFVKYWGKTNAELNIPLNNSISMTLSAAQTTTTVEFDEQLTADTLTVLGRKGDIKPEFGQRVSKHLDRLRALAGVATFAHIVTENSFPTATGFASSASGLAALTVAGAAALGLALSERELSILARQGSGSACRSIPGGFVEWYAGMTSDDSFATQIAPPNHWDIVDVAVIVSRQAKAISSGRGHLLSQGSPFWEARQARLPDRLTRVREAILARDFDTFGRELESEAISLHAIAMTSPYESGSAWHSGIYYWTPDTLDLLIAVQQWRADGLSVYFTLDAGPTVHLICPASQKDVVISAIETLQHGRTWTLMTNAPAPGAHLIDT